MPNIEEITLPIYSENAQFSLDRRLQTTHFACDLNACKGACCTMEGSLGAPILESEIPILEEVFPIVKKYLPQQALDTIEVSGIWQREHDGTFTIPAIEGKDCVFVRYDGEMPK